jgi:hypothetical protein
VTKTKLNLVKAVNAVVDPLVGEMTAGLQATLAVEGWDPTDVGSARISSKPKKLTMNNSIEAFTASFVDSDASFKQEFGSQTSTPKATVRKFMSNERAWEKRAAKLIERKAFK